MKFSRRDLLIGGAGALAGFALTPVPWKLLSDVSIWTQNFPWIPQPAQGPVETKFTACTLCEGGCGIRVRMAAKFAVGVAGVRSHPLTQGALCPLAYAAHQLNWHPSRLREVRHNGRTASWADAQAAFRKAVAEGPVAIVDGRPGRAISSVFEAFAEKHNAQYQTVLSAESQSLQPYALGKVPVASLGYDLENARTIVSFGAPLLDGWGTPGRFTHLWAERSADFSDPKLRIIQIESAFSRSAMRAWRWVGIGDGSEAGLAAGLARVLLEDHLVPAKGPMPRLELEAAAAQTGLPAEAIRELAHTLVENRPVVAIATDGNPAIAALNVLLGAVGAPGGIIRKSTDMKSHFTPSTTPGTLRAVLIDSAVPWDYSVQTDSEVFRFAAWDGGGESEGWLLPAPGFLEELTDVPTPPTSARETYAIAVNLVAPVTEVQSAAQFLQKIDPAMPEVEKLIAARCGQIFHAKRGTIYGDKPTEVAKIDSAQHLEDQLQQGAVWMDDPPGSATLECELKEWPTAESVTQAGNWTAAWTPPVLPALATKLFQESNLRELPAGRQA